MLAIVKMLRVPNLLMVGFTFLMLRYLVFIPVYTGASLHTAMGNLEFVMMITATILIAAAGYLGNDYFDVPADQVNKPRKQYIGRQVSAGTVLSTAWLLSLAALAFTTGLCISMKTWLPAIPLLVALAVVWWYAVRLKKSLLWGNIAVSCMTAGTIVMAWFIEKQASGIPAQAGRYITQIVAAISLFAFLLNLMREIIKDMEDIEGDRIIHCRSLPVVIGIPATKKILYVLAAFTTGLLVLAQVKLFRENFVAAAAWLMIAVEIPLLYFVVALSKSHAKDHFHTLSIWLKWIMLGGMMTMVAGQF